MLWILFIFIVVGNSSVLLALFKSKNRKSRMNFFIMHLAIADLLVGVVSVLIDIIWRITITWHAGNFACKSVRYLQVLVTYSSTYVLVALSIDRYDAIRHPMKFSGSWRRAKFLIGTAWVLSALFSIPIPILYNVELIQGRQQCWLDFPHKWQWQVYMTLIASAVFIIPAGIIIGCYTVIVYTIWSKSSHIVIIDSKKKHSSKRSSKNRPKRYQEDCDSRRASSRGLIPRAKVKTIKMTFVIVIVFIICWSPYFVFDLLQVYGYIPETQTSVAIATFIQSLAPLNSAANPVIYCLFSTRVCSILWRMKFFKWITIPLSICFPDLKEESMRSTSNGGCLGYGAESSATYTETLTQSSRRSRLQSTPSLRQIVVYRINQVDTANGKQTTKAEATIV